MTRARLVLFRLVLVAIPLAGVALASELALPRLAPVGRTTFHAWGNRPDTRLPGVVHRTVTPNFDVSFRTNALGFNDVEHPLARPPGTRRVLLLGDSFVEGYAVEQRDHLARVLERLAARDGVRLEAISMGVAGWGQSQQLGTYEVVGRQFEPDVVVTFFCANDLWNNLTTQTTPAGPVPVFAIAPDGSLAFQLADVPETPPSAEALRRHERPARSEGLRVLRRLVVQSIGLVGVDLETTRAARLAALYEVPDDVGAPAADGPAGFRVEHRLMFEKLAERFASDVIRRDGRELLNVVVTGNVKEQMPAKYARLLAWVTETFAVHGVETVDLETDFRERMRHDPRVPVFATDPHWNAVGHAWAAEALWARLGPRFAASERRAP